MLDYSERSNKTKLLYCAEEGEEVFRISYNAYVENIVTMYLDWREYPNYKYCKVCGKEIKTTGNNKKYCSKCAKDKELEKHRRYNAKRT
jgi:tRNA(Ile2) C34 agmatinyltransferase TiaS